MEMPELLSKSKTAAPPADLVSVATVRNMSVSWAMGPSSWPDQRIATIRAIHMSELPFSIFEEKLAKLLQEVLRKPFWEPPFAGAFAFPFALTPGSCSSSELPDALPEALAGGGTTIGMPTLGGATAPRPFLRGGGVSDLVSQEGFKG